MEKTPSLPLSASDFSPVAWFVIVTCACGTVAPDVSRTVPLIVDDALCANRLPAARQKIPHTASARMANRFSFMPPPEFTWIRCYSEISHRAPNKLMGSPGTPRYGEIYHGFPR